MPKTKKSTSPFSYLLDVNVLLALTWPNHQFHGLAHEWFAAHRDLGWATCTLVELAFVRLSMHPSFTKSPATASQSFAMLEQIRTLGGHHSAHDSGVTIGSDPGTTFSKVVGSKQVNDAYLIQLAYQHGAKLATFDRRLKVLAMLESQLEIIG